MASERPRRQIYSQLAIMKPYSVPRRGLRNPVWLVAPALMFFCFVYGFIFALTAPYLIVPMLVPLVFMALIVIWALPDAEQAPTGTLAGLAYAFTIGLIMWPNYLGVSPPGVPWITVIRIIGVPMAVLLLICLSVSQRFRSELWQVMQATPVIWIGVTGFAVVVMLTMFMSHHFASSMQRAVISQVNWTVVFFAGCWIFRRPGQVERFAATIWVMAVIISLIGILEHTQHKVLWADHIPSWVTEEAQHNVESNFRSNTYAYRSKATFTTPLGLAEFLALSVPLIMQFAIGAYSRLIKLLALASLPVVIWCIVNTDSRLGLVGSLVAFLAMTLAWAVTRWRRNTTDLLGPVVLLAYPVMAAIVVGMTFASHRLHTMVWGGGAQQSSTMARQIQWDLGRPKIVKNPFGYGAGESGPVVGYRVTDLYSVDTYYLTLLVDYGVLGFALFILAFGSAIWYGGVNALTAVNNRDQRRDIAFLTPLAVALVAFLVIKSVFSQQDLHPLLFLEASMIAALSYRVRAGEKAPAPVTQTGAALSPQAAE
jgi:hypothetical protein